MQFVETWTLFSHLICSRCGSSFDGHILQTFSSCCKKPLEAAYDTNTGLDRQTIKNRENTLWRYHEMLPVINEENIVSLGEGMTPVIPLKVLGQKYGLEHLYLKDESLNPTGSFKARGLSVAISKAKELGVECCIIPTAGNAGGAMSAYCAKAGIPAIVVMPAHTPKIFKQECELFGAELVLVEGLISDCAKKVNEIRQQKNCFDMSTLKEPYRLEGKKTLGYEIAEQFDWDLPDVIIYPTGGGTGLIGMWKAFYEMIALGWIGMKLPRMIAVQTENCQPVVSTWTGKQQNASQYKGTASLANGLAVPNPFGEDLILETIRESGGTAIAVTEKAVVEGVKEMATKEGLLIAPEGGAIWKGLIQLVQDGLVGNHEKILLLNTGSGYKYLENIVIG